MTVQHTPAPARSGARPVAPAAAAGTPFRRHGLTLAVGAGLWATAIAAVGFETAESGLRLEHAAGAVFQLGLLALLRVLWRTEALGTGRLARGVIRVEAGAVLLAMCSTLGVVIGIEDPDRMPWVLFDVCWPLSMMGMFLIGIRIAVAGRWTGARRWWPMVAESWAVVVIPTMAIAGQDAARVVASLHLLVGYTVLGLLVSRKQG